MPFITDTLTPVDETLPEGSTLGLGVGVVDSIADAFSEAFEFTPLSAGREAVAFALRSTTHHLMADPTVDFDEADAKAIYARLGLTEAGGLE